MVCLDLICAAQRAPEPQLPFACLDPPRSLATTVALEVSGLHLPICKTGGLDSLLSKRPSSWSWGGLERGLQKGGPRFNELSVPLKLIKTRLELSRVSDLH